ncbi:hypothetical protein B296_00022563 [Ensete ventricosum]|uniref:Uncharacterized protein n=1 Tax=Ensete ventricosum TaxID=4639 RepID=A0A427A9S7_ENSVE|nr:hypothetical protein B296_00022563 [Ensete ventricosum]
MSLSTTRRPTETVRWAKKAYAQTIMEKHLRRKDEPEYPDHDDALVVSVCIVNPRVKRVKIDTRGDSITPLGMVVLPVTIGSKTMIVTFMVVNLSSMYNVILGRSVLKKMRVIVSTYHRAMKFLTQVGIREVRSDPREFKQYDLATIMLPKKLKHGLNHSPFDRPLVDPREVAKTLHQLELMEWTLEVPLNKHRPAQVMKIVSMLLDKY